MTITNVHKCRGPAILKWLVSMGKLRKDVIQGGTLISGSFTFGGWHTMNTGNHKGKMGKHKRKTLNQHESNHTNARFAIQG